MEDYDIPEITEKISRIIEDSSILFDMNENEKLTIDIISQIISENGSSLKNLIKLYNYEYDFFEEHEIMSIIKTLSFLDSKKLNEMLLFVKLYRKDINISLLDDNLILQFNSIKIENEEEKWKDIIKYGFIDLYIYLCKIKNIYFSQTKNEAFIISCKYGHLAIVEILFNKNVDIHFRDDLSLSLAVKNGHLEIVKFLLNNKFNHNSILTYIGKYFNENQLEMSNLLIDYLIENQKYKPYKTLEYFVIVRNATLVKFLIDKETIIKDINIEDFVNLLNYAYKGGDLDIVIIILNGGVRCGKIDKKYSFELNLLM